MRVYARPGLRMARQLGGDLLLVAWVALWAWLARMLHAAVLQLAVPARQSGNLAAQLGDQMRSSQEQLGHLPAVGSAVGEPFGSLASGLDQLSAMGEQQVAQITHVALLAGWLCFLVPVVTGLAVWVPRRWRFVRDARLAQRFIDADADLELFALRGMANLPMHEIARISDDPVGRWRACDRDVIAALAARELERTGLDMPAPVRSVSDDR